MTTYTRRARLSDLDAISTIIDHAIAFLAEQDSPQWQHGDGPSREEFETAITEGIAYVQVYEGKVSGIAKLIPGPEGPYEEIEGSWAGDATQYMTIHRVGMDGTIRGKGLAQQFLQDLLVISLEQGFNDIRMDTYPKNVIMQKVMTNLGFDYRGMVEMPVPHGERMAYQLILD